MGSTTVRAANPTLRLSVLEEHLAVCRLDPRAELPPWATSAPFFCVARTTDELSVVCPEERIPEGTASERGWRAIKVEGPFGFELTGVLASVVAPLAESEVSILAIATYVTDYVLVKEEQLGTAIAALRKGGHEVR